MTRAVDASISRRMLRLAETKGTIIVLIHVMNRCIIVNAERKFERYEKSGSFFEVSWARHWSFALPYY